MSLTTFMFILVKFNVAMFTRSFACYDWLISIVPKDEIFNLQKNRVIWSTRYKK